MVEWSASDLTIRQRERLERLHRRYLWEPLPEDLPGILEEQLGVGLASRYAGLVLRHPLMVAPGHWTGVPERVEAAAEAGWAVVVLRTAAAWGKDGSASLAALRASGKGAGPRSLYSPADVRRERPALLWDRRLDSRGPQDYLGLVRLACAAVKGSGTAVVASLASSPERAAAELPGAGREVIDAGASALEVLWSPAEAAWTEQLRGLEGPWSLRVVCADVSGLEGRLLEEAEKDLRAAPFLSLDFGTPAKGAPRPFRPGDLAGFLSSRGLAGGSVAAAGGVYSGRDALAYITQGAVAVQVCSFIAGKVATVLKPGRNKFEQVLFRLLLDPRDGLAAGLTALKNRCGIRGVADAVGLAYKTGGGAAEA